MNLNAIVDIALSHIYNNNGSYIEVSKICQQNNIDFNSSNSGIICAKFKQVDLFEVHEYASKYGYDSGLTPSLKGYEFYQKYGSYSNYLDIQHKAEEKAQRLAEKSAKGTHWSGIGALIAIPLSVISIAFSIYSYYQTNKLAKVNDATADTLKSIKTQVKEIAKPTYKRSLPVERKDSLVNLKRR